MSISRSTWPRYADVLWRDIDLDAAEWEVVGKNSKVDILPLSPPLLRAFRVYRRWQLSQHPGGGPPGIDAVNGMTSRVTPHCFRRAWATIARNDEKNPTPIDVVSEVLRHKEIATTRRHYAPTKSDRARALIGMQLT